MGRIMGRRAWEGFFCHCCNSRRSNSQQRQVEKREWMREQLSQDMDEARHGLLSEVDGVLV